MKRKTGEVKEWIRSISEVKTKQNAWMDSVESTIRETKGGKRHVEANKIEKKIIQWQ